MTSTTTSPVADAPAPGQLVSVRDRRWVVVTSEASALQDGASANGSPPQHLVTLASIEDEEAGNELRVVWELEPGREIIEETALPEVDSDRRDDPARLDAFLDAVRWGAVTSADSRALHAPFRSGIAIEDFQLDPVVRALGMPRANLLVADDVGLGKTIEAGLVIQELLLRHRARTVIVVCPASLQIKWQQEMREKFGLEFRIVDRELLRHLRRTRGTHVNPFSHFPRLIVSMDWLKADRPMSLLREVLPPVPTYPRRFDVLIVDEVHNVAPAGGGSRYKTDTLRTMAVRTLAPHCEHRLFLSATPHNGYANSFSALLELLDPQRFARGVEPDRGQLAQVMVRRLKSEITNPDGSRRFPERKVISLEVSYTDEERAVHADLKRYGDLRLTRIRQDAGGRERAAEFVQLLFKKRLFSSSAAFARTLEQHRRTLASAGEVRDTPPPPSVLRAAEEDLEADFADEQEQEEAVERALATAADMDPHFAGEERDVLGRLEAWADRERHREDTKCGRLLDWLDETLRPEGAWNDERVIVFTEYLDTERYLRERLAARGVPGERVLRLYGGMDQDERESVKARFQAGPEVDPVRILVATDAASEGIDLQRHCHRIVHYEIPWNPNRLEQRNGRVDRHGQRADEVLTYHFVGSGYEDAGSDSLEADLEFLSIAARKVAQIGADLGSVGPVIAEQVEQAMLGRRKSLETATAERRSPARTVLRVERDIREQVARLHERLVESRDELRLDPDNVRRVVATALELAGQPALLPAGEGEFRLPVMTGSWNDARQGLAQPVTGKERPITFDHDRARGRDDVVLVHLGHRLVQLALALLRAEIWKRGPTGRLARVTARFADGQLEHPVVLAHARLVVTGADGHRLHEELIAAGATLADGRFRRLNVGETAAALSATTGDPAPDGVWQRLAARRHEYETPLRGALEARARDRFDNLSSTLGRRADREVDAAAEVLTELGRSIEAALREPEVEQLELFSDDERRQLERDLDGLRTRLERIPTDIETEAEAIRSRYADPEPRVFPAALSFVVPRAGGLA